jgi:hypothetical protein
MMRAAKGAFFCVASILCLLSQRVGAQAPDASPRPVPQIFRLELDASDLKQPSWIILLRSDGTGLYWPTLTAKYDQVHLRVSDATWKRVHAGAAAVQADRCETKVKNIAKTGVKDVEYHAGTTPDTYSSCSFNYSDDAGLNDAVTALEEIVETMQAGERLKHKHRFDHLGLDAELDSLLARAKDGQAIELQNIAPVLQSIADDDEMMSPSRRKAKSLLELGGIHTEPGA